MDGSSIPPKPRGGEGLQSRGKARRRAILDAAQALFVEKGYADTTLAEIVRRAGGSRATLYLFFGDKAGLFRAMMEENNADIVAALVEAHADNPASPEEELSRVAQGFLRALSSDRTAAILRILVSEGARIPDIVQSFYKVGPDTVLTRLSCYFLHLADTGALAVEDPRAAAQAFLGMVGGNFLLRRLILPDEQISQTEADAYIRQVVALFMGGARC